MLMLLFVRLFGL